MLYIWGLTISLVMIATHVYFFYYPRQIGSINHKSSFRVMWWNNDVGSMSYYDRSSKICRLATVIGTYDKRIPFYLNLGALVLSADLCKSLWNCILTKFNVVPHLCAAELTQLPPLPCPLPAIVVHNNGWLCILYSVIHNMNTRRFCCGGYPGTQSEIRFKISN